MNKLFFVLICSFVLFSFIARAQVMEGRYDGYVAPMDGAVARHHKALVNLKNPGDAEDLKSQEDRYAEMTGAMDEANVRHFDPIKNVVDLDDSPFDVEIENLSRKDLDINPVPQLSNEQF